MPSLSAVGGVPGEETAAGQGDPVAREAGPSFRAGRRTIAARRHRLRVELAKDAGEASRRGGRELGGFSDSYRGPIIPKDLESQLAGTRRRAFTQRKSLRSNGSRWRQRSVRIKSSLAQSAATGSLRAFGTECCAAIPYVSTAGDWIGQNGVFMHIEKAFYAGLGALLQPRSPSRRRCGQFSPGSATR